MAKNALPPSLKAENNKAIWLLVSTDIVVITLVVTGYAFTHLSLTDLTQSVFVRGIFLTACGPLVAVFLNDLLPSNVKTSIVFWRLKNALPGHRAFSEHADADPRIDMVVLKRKVGEFPKSARDQNAYWYHLFQKHQSNVIISDSHKRFLLFRDSTSLTLMLVVIFTIVAAASGTPRVVQATVIGGLVLQFIWLAISARNTGTRLVQNVIALESSHNKEKKK